MVSTVLALALTFAVILVISAYDAGPILRGRVIRTLSDRFQGKVELGVFHVTVKNGFHVSGQDLRIYGKNDPNTHLPGVQPLFGIASFSFSIGWWNLLHTPTHVDTVHLEGLLLNIPPKSDRGQMASLRKHGKGKIYVDYLRNAKGATAIAPYSTRARPGAPVSVPIAWDELSVNVRSDHFTVANVAERLKGLRRDPWRDYFAVKQKLTPKMKVSIGVSS